jgi:hypothetical protein
VLGEWSPVQDQALRRRTSIKLRVLLAGTDLYAILQNNLAVGFHR